MINLMLGDCLERMKEIPAGSVDLVLTDPPYGTTACKWDSVIPFEPMWKQLYALTKERSVIAMFCQQPFSSALGYSNLRDLKYEWIWEKERPTNPLMVKKAAPKYHEQILIFYRKQPMFNPQYIPRKEENKRNNKPRGYADKTKTDSGKYEDMVTSGTNDYIYQPDILKVSMERGLHPTQKPVGLLETLIKTYTNEGDTVLDFTMGSGSTGVACRNLNRKFIGIEMDENYFNIAKQRISEALN